MGIEIKIEDTTFEYNNILALRKFGTLGRDPSECLPWKLKVGENYEAIKSGQRFFPRDRDIPLVETKGNQQFSDPIARVRIYRTTQFTEDKVKTKIEYRLTEIIDKDYFKRHFQKNNEPVRVMGITDEKSLKNRSPNLLII